MSAHGKPAFYRRWLSPEGYLSAHLAVGFVVALLAGWLLATLAQDVFGAPGGVGADEWAQAVARARAHPLLTRVMKVISFVGRPPALGALSLAVGLWLLLAHSRLRLYAFAATMLGGSALNLTLKLLVRRARPLTDPPLPAAYGYSFPSGHSMGSMLFFGSLAYVIYFTSSWPRRLRLAGLALCLSAALAIGASRVYLGVHYLSDVVAGFLAALCWMGVCLTGTESWTRWRDWQRRRGRARARAAPATAHGLSAAIWVAGPFLSLAAVPALAAPPPPCAACLAWEASAGEARRLLEHPGPLDGLEVFLRSEADGEASTAELESALAQRGVGVGWVQPLVATGGEPGERAGRPSSVLVDAREAAALGPDELAFRIKTLATAFRSRGVGAVGLEAPAHALPGLWERGLAPYLDFVVQPLGADAEVPAPEPFSTPGPARWGRLLPWHVASVTEALQATRTAAFERLLAPWPAGGEVALALRVLRDVLPSGLSPLPDVRIGCASSAATGEGCQSEVFLHPGTLEAVAVVRPRAAVEVAWVRPGASRAELYTLAGPEAGRRPLPVQAGPSAAHLTLPALDATFLLRIAGWSGLDEGRFRAGLEVVEEKTLSIAEVIARHQAAMARQRQLVRRLIATGHTLLSFQAPGLAAPVTIAAETILYTEGDTTEIEQRRIRLNGLDLVATGADGVPRLPIVEPERVSRAPLAIALTEAYRYRLEGRERVHGRDAYVVAFEPKDDSQPLFRGRAWIATRSFALLRTGAAQTGLRGPIVSSEQRDEFVPVAVGEETVWLLARSEINQIYEGAGHRTPIQRVVTLARHEPDPEDFEARLRLAHASDSVMLRDTPEGFRYLRRVRAGQDPSRDAPTRVLSADRASRVRTLAAGAIVDPNISVPLPFAGLSYLDFDFLGTGTQVNAFFAISLAQAAWAVPSLGGSRWQLHGSVFGTLAEYNDRAFRQGLEQYPENLRQRPARLNVALVRLLSPRLRARAGYELSYTRLRRSDLTGPGFAAPVSPLVHGLHLSLEGQRGPWTAALWWNPARRQRWRPWGWPDNSEVAPEHAGFQRFGASASRSFVLSSSALARVEGAWMAGTDLDRFSRYSFDAFENRLRGYPSAGLRFDRGAVLRSVLTWNAAPGLRLDAFADTARVHDPGFGPGLRSYSGLGGGLEFPLPWRALVSLEWGYGIQGRNREGETGTHVFRLTAYKIF